MYNQGNRDRPARSPEQTQIREELCLRGTENTELMGKRKMPSSSRLSEEHMYLKEPERAQKEGNKMVRAPMGEEDIQSNSSRKGPEYHSRKKMSRVTEQEGIT